LKLRPVTYRYKQANDNGENPVEYGLIAEEVAKVYPELVAHSADGQIETVQYHKLTPMLLNELQVMHKLLANAQDKEKLLEAQLADERLKNQEQASDMARLMRQVESLNSQAKTIASLTERLSRMESRQVLGLNR
jgi:predicted Zn-dependent peptidase